MQSSITAWLKKPTSSSVKETVAVNTVSTTYDSINLNPTKHESQLLDATLPTPPPEETRIKNEEKGHEQDNEDDEDDDHETNNEFINTTIKQPFLTPSISTTRPLISNLTLEPCTSETILSFKRLNTTLLPIPYPPKFYNEILTDPITASLTLLAIWRDNDSSSSSSTSRVVGGISCRIIPPPSSPSYPSSKPILYISTLAVLSPYRHYGIASHLLSCIISTALTISNNNPPLGVPGSVGAHVWVCNQDARDWYQQRGFVEEKVEESYYRRLEPRGAVVVRRSLGVRDFIACSSK